MLFNSTRTVCPLTVTTGASCPLKSRDVNSTRLFAPAFPGRVDRNSTWSVLLPELRFEETRAASAPCKVKMRPAGTVSAMIVPSTPRSRLTKTFDATCTSSDIARIKSDAVVLFPARVLTSILIRPPSTLKIGQLAGFPGMLADLDV